MTTIDAVQAGGAVAEVEVWGREWVVRKRGRIWCGYRNGVLDTQSSSWGTIMWYATGDRRYRPEWA